MKDVTKMAFQGDVMFRRVDALPADAVADKGVVDVVVAHSETGHHHSIPAGQVRWYPPAKDSDGLTSHIVQVADAVDVVHHRPWDTHETLRLLGGVGAVWEVRRQREWSPEGWRRVED